MSEHIDIRTEQRADGWAVVVIDKYARHERSGLSEEEAESLAIKMVQHVQEIFNFTKH